MDVQLQSNHIVEDCSDIYLAKFGSSIPRTGKVFSYTFWRTQINKAIFWSVQGNDYENIGCAWIATQFFGPAEQGNRFVQEIVLTHPTDKHIQMTYCSTLAEGKNYIFISRNILHHFKNEDNSFNFDFKIIRTRRKPYPVRRF